MGAGAPKGLAWYCRPEHLYLAGRSGCEYRGVCPNDMQSRWLFELGRQGGRINNALTRELLLFQPQRLAEVAFLFGAAGTFAADEFGFADYLAQRFEISGDFVANDYLYNSTGVL